MCKLLLNILFAKSNWVHSNNKYIQKFPFLSVREMQHYRQEETGLLLWKHEIVGIFWISKHGPKSMINVVDRFFYLWIDFWFTNVATVLAIQKKTWK